MLSSIVVIYGFLQPVADAIVSVAVPTTGIVLVMRAGVLQSSSVMLMRMSPSPL
jgi:hypothetical protein